ncbi:ferritin-like domain-containing protein [Halolamina rubra]|uniref:ferritin-like domain-containing protein n=1 Tax=Halolamina rubra TaxID=1380430 RepID=UPI001F2C6C9A|nr:ferritin-like domain-containing protein [Halolamina rubra]
MHSPPIIGDTMTDTNDPQTTATDESSASRRGFLTRSALAGGALLALGGGAGVALADEHVPTEAPEAAFDDVDGTDVDVLNYALSLEHLERALYAAGFETFDEEAFLEADALSAFDEATRETVYGFVGTMAEHETQHVSVLGQAVELLGGEPAAPAEYNFEFETVGEFLSLATVIENTGVAAYAGAAPFVESPDLLSVALSIHSVEARHAAVLNWLTGASPFPDAFDAASSQSEVMDAVSQFIVEEETDDGEPGTEPPADGNETATPADGDGTETPMGNETATPAGNETETTMGNETMTPSGNETATPDGG